MIKAVIVSIITCWHNETVDNLGGAPILRSKFTAYNLCALKHILRMIATNVRDVDRAILFLVLTCNITIVIALEYMSDRGKNRRRYDRRVRLGNVG